MLACGVTCGMEVIARENYKILNVGMIAAEEFEMLVLERSNEATAGVE